MSSAFLIQETGKNNDEAIIEKVERRQKKIEDKNHWTRKWIHIRVTNKTWFLDYEKSSDWDWEGKRDNTGTSGVRQAFEEEEEVWKTLHCPSFSSKDHPLWTLHPHPGSLCLVTGVTLEPWSHLCLLWELCPERVDQPQKGKSLVAGQNEVITH